MPSPSRTRNVLTIGTFDLLHYGHINFLKRCAQFGNLTVGINTDEFVEEYKKRRPIVNYWDRRLAVAALDYAVRENNGPGFELILDENPDILIVASDWARKDYYAQIGMSQDELDKHNIILCYIPYTWGISSTRIREQMRDA